MFFKQIISFLQGLFEFVPGSLGQVLLLALFSVFAYWVVDPRLRKTTLALISIVVFLILGASYTFVILIILLTLTTYVAIQPLPKEVTPNPSTRLINWLSLICIVSVYCFIFVSGSIGDGHEGMSQTTINLAFFFVASSLVIALIAQVMRLNPGKFSSLASQLASWIKQIRHSPRFLRTLIVYVALLMWPIGYLIYNKQVPLQELKNIVFPSLFLLYFFLCALVALWSFRLVLTDYFARLLCYITIVLVLLAFIVYKSPLFPVIVITGWIGYSYFAFRILHVVLDRLNNRHVMLSPLDMIVYALFFPAILVGPIDRLPRFLNDLRDSPAFIQRSWVVEGGIRILIGCAKKYFLADVIFSQLALGSAPMPNSTVYAWVQLYSYSFFLLFDFSGFIDIALGIGVLLGFRLPENFNFPYLKSNITQFWQAWHITFSNWLRTYIFFPVSKRLLRTHLRKYPLVIVFCAQLTTMILAGLWHGITVNFVLWGIWHGIGLFTHKVYMDNTRRFELYLQEKIMLKSFVAFIGIVLTFHFVLIGWVFFSLPSYTDAIIVLKLLFRL
jgi:D-alanyl-lipoteichoic acid acyltransferase DltB (MBOAT superfamily)